MAEADNSRDVMEELVACEGASQKLERYIKHAENLVQRCNEQPKSINGKNKLLRKIISELNFLQRLKDKSAKLKESSLNSSNLMNLEGIVRAIESFPNVTHAMKPFPMANSERPLLVDVICNDGFTWLKVIARKPQALHLIWAGAGQFGEKDISSQAKQFISCAKKYPKNYALPQVIFIFCQGITSSLKCHLEELGIKVQGSVVDIDPSTETKLLEIEKDFEDSNSDDNDGHLEKKIEYDFNFGALNQEEDCVESDSENDSLVTASELFALKLKTVGSQNNAQGQQASNPSFVKKKLSMCATSSDAIEKPYKKAQDVNVIEKDQDIKEDSLEICKLKTSFDTSQCELVTTPDIKKLNLDVSTMIVLVSNVCHGQCNFVFEDDILSYQAECERKEPVLPRLEKFMDGKELFACKTAVDSFQKIVQIVGGEEEKRRAERLMAQITIVEDSMSEKTKTLKCSAQVKKRAKIIFGTGDDLQAITMSANMGFIRAAENQGFNLAVFLHDSRALTEQKEVSAKPYVCL